MSFTLWFMGKPASGKSTLAKQIENHLREVEYDVENLDGDEIRRNMHPDLGFTREERALNNRRTAYICQLLNRNDISAVTGMITPFREAQHEAREIVEEEGQFVLVYVKCSTEECARRDPKNLYEKAEEGKIENFTAVNHPFQEPHDAEIIVDTEQKSVEESVTHIKERLTTLGVLSREPREHYEFEMDRETESQIKDRLRDMGYIE